MVFFTRSLSRLATRPSPCARSIFTASAVARTTPTWTTRSTAFRSQKLNNTFGNVRMLTGNHREKVKVLLVLYDGKKHAEEVCLIYFTPLLDFGVVVQLLQLSILSLDQLTNMNTIRSQSFSAQPRTSSVSANGSRIKDMSSSPPPTRRERTPSSTSTW